MDSNRYSEDVLKNILIPITSFLIEEIDNIWLADSIQGDINVPPIFDNVNWIKCNKNLEGKFECTPNGLVTDLIVVVNEREEILGYLNKLFNFSYTKLLQFELRESIDVKEQEKVIEINYLYEGHSKEDPSVHVNFFSKVLTSGNFSVLQNQYEQYQKDYINNPLIKDKIESPGQYTFSEYYRKKDGNDHFKAVRFPSVQELSKETGYSFSNMRIGFNYLEGYYLFKIINNIILIITPNSRKDNQCRCIILKSDKNLNPYSRIFSFAGNYYLVSNGELIVVVGGETYGKTLKNYTIYDYSENTETRIILDSAIAFEFSHIGDIVINKNDNKFFSVLNEINVDLNGDWYNPYYKQYPIDNNFISRIKQIYKNSFDNWLINHKLSSECILSNRWCLFKHKSSGKILATSNYPIKGHYNRRVFTLSEPIFIDNDFLIKKSANKLFNLELGTQQDLVYTDIYLGSRLLTIGGEYIIC